DCDGADESAPAHPGRSAQVAGLPAEACDPSCHSSSSAGHLRGMPTIPETTLLLNLACERKHPKRSRRLGRRAWQLDYPSPPNPADNDACIVAGKPDTG